MADRQQQDEDLPQLPVIVREAPRQFHVAFGLMSVIPFLICCYLLMVRFFSIEILMSVNGIYILLAAVFSVLGLLVGQRIIRKTVNELTRANAKAQRLLAELETANGRLQQELAQRQRTEEQLTADKAQLERANKLMMDREARILELKQEVNAALEAGHHPKRYDLST